MDLRVEFMAGRALSMGGPFLRSCGQMPSLSRGTQSRRAHSGSLASISDARGTGGGDYHARVPRCGHGQTRPKSPRGGWLQTARASADSVEALSQVSALGDLGDRLLRLPRTTGGNYGERARALCDWQMCLAKGILPDAADLDVGQEGGENLAACWPEEPFRSAFLSTLADLEIAPFLRRHSKLVDVLLSNMMDLVEHFEHSFPEGVGDQDAGQSTPGGSSASLAGEEGDEGREEARRDAAREAAERAVEGLMSQFEEEWRPVVDAAEAAEDVFEDIEDLFRDLQGSDKQTVRKTRSVWKHSGWAEVKELGRQLEALGELRRLVRDLGRGSRGRGPKRVANKEEFFSGNPEGLVTSNLIMEETAGLYRSGELTTMLPCESSLLALGKRRKVLRSLWHCRRAERSLMSYERVGWLEDEPSRMLDELEFRPSGLQGPIILCLDTSASMQGSREKVAKAVVLECVRNASKQNRGCFLFAFSGFNEVQELNLSSKDVMQRSHGGASASGERSTMMTKLLDFLACTFDGGTDVNEPLKRSLDLLTGKEEEWTRADIVLVSDGEIPKAKPELKESLDHHVEENDLKIHALIVGPKSSDAVNEICTDVHLFHDWDALKDKSGSNEVAGF